MKSESIKDLEPGTYYIHPDTLGKIKQVCVKNPIGAYFLLSNIKFVPNTLIDPGKLVKI